MMNKITSLAIIAALCAAGASATGEGHDEHEYEWKNRASSKAGGSSKARTVGAIFDVVALTDNHATADCWGENCGAQGRAVSDAFAADYWGSEAIAKSDSRAGAMIEDTVATAGADTHDSSDALGPHARAVAKTMADANAYSYLWKKDHGGDNPTPPPEHKWDHGDDPVPPHKPWGYKPWSRKPKWGWAHE
ncbi:hypothetical protein HOP50_11g64290 [Chloropicon primus]|uniref:Uncharacterized protein n=1 Tax=Chloropicon primus TaxID=1764295 RepID=A0A5B8MTD5_9CHLO|nr:hypothetical protein A3770_11p64070 [Chloropicon primus]QDZ23891.1 hypothetical protein A3770_11p64090 [Chloropicon primus]UPR03102.1 hypothetical protein HOP50_11g64290 [Chloropicon primus]|eukprot:QDZ23889.1 hypothetical protein A3770_11p64070 [Chloropicon primus]